MVAATLFVRATATTTVLWQSLMPSLKPTISRDTWQCVTENITQYFDVPRPTTSLESAIGSYGSELLKSCTLPYKADCRLPDATRWCELNTALPTSLRPAYSSYASSASAWWEAKSSKAVELVITCPNTWWLEGYPVGYMKLNQTLYFADCYARDHASGILPQSTTAAAVPTITAHTASVSIPKVTANGIGRRIGIDQEWVLAAAVIIAVVGGVVL